MSSRPLLSAFTPSNTNPELLERIFVQREKLLSAITNRLARSMTSGEKYHVLLIGPRGSGKTNLVTLAIHRLKMKKELGDAMRIAWLGEDNVMVELIDIALAIADQLAQDYPGEFTADPRTSIRGLSGDDAAIAILNLIVTQLKHRNLILVMENLDRVFAGLGDLGQKRWRAFLQETTRVATLATSQQIFEGVSSRDEAFFGFFDLHHLEPLSVDDASELIRNVAIEQGMQDLVKFLDSSTGRYRIRALHHLAGGNHRMYVLLAAHLTKDSLDDMVESFEQLAEELTPYFQERMRSLPPQQAKLVQCLANSEGARTVKEISEETFVAEGNCSKQLGNLRQAGYVISSKRGKESYYELAEPLMRLCLEVKNQRGKPLKLVAKFLKVWFPASSLTAFENKGDEVCTRGDEYRREAIAIGRDFEMAIKDELSLEIAEMIKDSKFQDARKLTEEMAYVDAAEAIWQSAEIALLEGNSEERVKLLTEFLSLPHTPDYKTIKALFGRGTTYSNQGNIDLAIADYSSIIKMLDTTTELLAHLLIIRGIAYQQRDNPELAIADYSSIIETRTFSTDLRTNALALRGNALHQQGKAKLAIADYSAIVEMPNIPPDLLSKTLFQRGFAHQTHGTYESAIADFSLVIKMPNLPVGQRSTAVLQRGLALQYNGKRESAIADFSMVIKMTDAAASDRATAYQMIGVNQWQDGLYTLAEESIKKSLAIEGVASWIRTMSLFVLPDTMVPNHNFLEVIKVLSEAFLNGDPQFDGYGGQPSDLLQMILQRGSLEWKAYSESLVPLYNQYRCTAKLGTGIVESIRHLDEGDYSKGQIKLWNEVWHAAGKNCTELELPLRCLAAATEVLTMESPTDRPLFQLPLEIRVLVRKLLSKTLGQPE